MKQIRPITIMMMLMLAATLSGCDVITGIFKTGMGVGAFIVIAIILVIVFFVVKGKKTKSNP